MLVAVSATAVAAADAAKAADEAAPAALEEVVVTAQKRAENLQDVPGSITAISGEALADQQIQDITDLQRRIPSMAVGQLYGANLITLRGISTGLTSGTEDPSVAVHVNGVYQPRSRSLDIVLMDLERVEVLAGPQGTLYGRNATGGVVNYITKGPTDAFEGEITGSVGNYDRYAVRGSVSGPISSAVGFRAAAIYDDQSKGFTRNLSPGAPNATLEDRKVQGGRLALDWRPSDRLRFDLDAMYLNSKTSTFFGAFAPSPVPAIRALLTPQSVRAHEIYSNVDSELDSEYGQVSLTGAASLSDNLDIKSISAYQNYIGSMNLDLDASAFSAVETHQDDKSHTFSQEVTVNHRAFNDRLTSVIGAFYLRDELKGRSRTNFLGTLLAARTDHKATTLAIYADETLQVTDQLKLIAGIRYTKDKKSASQSRVVNVTTVCSPFVTREWTSWTPRIGLQYQVRDELMVYAQWQKGFKAGGIAANTCGNAFDPEGIKGPEVGFKSEWFDRRLRLNAAAYYYDYSGLQLQKVVGVGMFSVQNAASAVLKGVEVSGQFIVTDRLRLDAAANVQSAKYTEFSSCNQAQFPGACTAADPRPFSAQVIDLSGNWLNRAPPYSLNVGAEYRLDLGGHGELLVRGESYWSGKTRYDEFGSAVFTQKAYNIQNVFLTYTPSSETFKVRAFVKNIGDVNYKISGFYLSGAELALGNWAPPRTYGVEFSKFF